MIVPSISLCAGSANSNGRSGPVIDWLDWEIAMSAGSSRSTAKKTGCGIRGVCGGQYER